MRKQGATWWSSRFLRSLERLGLSSRLRAGRAYLKTGRVIALEVHAGGVTSRVRDEESEHECQLYFEPLTDFEWVESLERLAYQDLSAAALLTTGRLPPHIEDFFRPSGRRLLPGQTQELEFHCTCGDRADVCKHVAATAFMFAERLDLDPWLLFLVRGRSAQQVKEFLAESWARDLSPPRKEVAPRQLSLDFAAPLTTEDVDLFWRGAPPPEGAWWEVESSKTGITAERLGTPEPRIEDDAWQGLLRDVYSAVSQRAHRWREKT